MSLRASLFPAVVIPLILASQSAFAQDWDEAAPVEGGGVLIKVEEVDMDDEDLEFEIKLYNRTNERVVVATRKIMIIPGVGKPLPGKNNLSLVVLPGASKQFDLDFESPTFEWDDVEDKGAWLRWDGITINGQPVACPPTKLGRPKHSAGQAPAPAPAAAAPTTPAPTSSSGLQQYSGQRIKIKDAGTKVAAMPLKISEVPEQIAFIIDELLLTELQGVGFEAIGPDDISALVGFETMKDEMGCDDASCVAEIGNALGVPFLVAGSVAKLDSSVVITLKLINVRETKVQARVSKIADGSAKVLPRVIGEVVQDMIKRSGL